MHKENSWVNPRTQVITAVNKIPGSPRMWPNRAFDTGGSIEASESIIKPKLLSVSAIWLRPCATIDFPYPSLIRFFDLQINQRNNKWVPKPDPTPAIGRAWQVPFEDILGVLRTLNHSGAYMIWWCTPEREKERAKTQTELGVRASVDHEKVYKMFDRGMTPRQVSEEMGVMVETIRYIQRKWRDGKPAEHMHFGRKPLDHLAIIDDLRTPDITCQAIADKHGCTRFTVHKLAVANKIYRS